MSQAISNQRNRKANYESEVNGNIPNDRVWGGSWLLLLHVILPIAITGLIVRRKTIFNKLLAYFDKICISVFCPSFSKREKLKKWLIEYLPFIDGVNGVRSIWQDGSLMCTLINSVVPGACLNPHRHWKRPPIHGQALAYKYLGVTPVFSEKDFELVQPTTTMENMLLEYMLRLQQAMDKLTGLKLDALSFSTRYIARGMGLITGEQHRRIIFYVYYNHTDHSDDLLINIRGPYNTFGCTTLSSSNFARNMNAKVPEKRASFLKNLSTDFSNLLKSKERDEAHDIEIRKEFEEARVKLTFIPNNSGVYEICLTTNGEHIAGSPFNLNIDKNRSGIIDDLNADAKTGKKKAINTVTYCETLKKPKVKTTDLKDLQEQEDCHIIINTGAISLPKINHPFNIKEEEVKLGNEESINSVNNEEMENNANTDAEITKPTNQLQTTACIDEHQKYNENQRDETNKSPKKDNFGLNIIDTIRDIPELVKIYTQISKQSQFTEIIDSVDSVGNLNIRNTENHTTNPAFHSQISPEPPCGNTFQPSESSPLDDTSEAPLEEIVNEEATETLENSVACINEEIDPDSLSLSVETHGSIEEMNQITGSENNSLAEMNNNDIMVKSNEDICYLVLNQRNARNRIYSKDFVSCKDDKSKNDFSRSDPNLLNTSNYENDSPQQSVSALSQDNVQEAYTSSLHPRSGQEHQTSRILIQHPHEGHIGCTRSHSYSYSNLVLPKRKLPQNLAFRENFLRRKAFWTNISESNVNLNRTEANVISKHSEFETTVVQRTKSLQKLNSFDDGQKSKSLDYDRRRTKIGWRSDMHFSYGDTQYGSVDDLNITSLKHRRELFHREQEGQCEKQEKFSTVKEDQFSRSIHDTIRYFEKQKNPANPPSENQQDNMQLRNKNISKRYELAASYFKSLENNSSVTDEQVKCQSLEVNNDA